MNIIELIEKHAGFTNSGVRRSYRRFAIELLEEVKRSARIEVVDPGTYVGMLEAQHNYGSAIKEALEELRK